MADIVIQLIAGRGEVSECSAFGSFVHQHRNPKQRVLDFDECALQTEL